MDIRLIKKSEKILMEKMKMMEEAEEENLPATVDVPESVAEEQSNSSMTARTPNYLPQQDYPLVQSVCNSGWQVSDIWRDIRLDNFCNY